MSEGRTGESWNGGQLNDSSDNAGQTNGDGCSISSSQAQRRPTQAALKLAEQSEQEAKNLELESEEVEQQYQGLKRTAEAEIRKKEAKKRSADIRLKIAEMEKNKSKLHQEAASEIVSTSSTVQTKTKTNPDLTSSASDPILMGSHRSIKRPGSQEKSGKDKLTSSTSRTPITDNLYAASRTGDGIRLSISAQQSFVRPSDTCRSPVVSKETSKSQTGMSKARGDIQKKHD